MSWSCWEAVVAGFFAKLAQPAALSSATPQVKSHGLMMMRLHNTLPLAEPCALLNVHKHSIRTERVYYFM